MKKSSKENLVNDIENRLDDFFDEDKETPSSETKGISLEKLKSVVLSIDWEITESCLNDLLVETDNLLPRFKSDRFSHSLLRMLKAVGAYIRKRKAQAHPDAIKRIMSVFSSIEKMMENPQMEEIKKKEIVAKEIIEFKKLKEQVIGKPTGDAQQSKPEAPGIKPNIGYEKLEKAMDDVEKRMNAQVENLKSQLETMKNELDNIRQG